jgi:hypothetical protein
MSFCGSKICSHKYAYTAAALKDIAQIRERRDCARRHYRPYKARALQRQRLPDLPAPESADKVLMRLNFSRRAVTA